MTKTAKKISLNAACEIPFDKLILSQANVRRTQAGVSIEELAEDIARRGLLQSLSVRPVLDADGVPMGMFEVPAGGRRFRALELLVKQKRLSRSVPVPCIVRETGIAEEDSLAENVQRVALHPLDQYRAFQALREKGQGEDEIAATFFVSVNVVKQRLRLASVSPKLLDIYAEDGLTLEQLMAFTVSGDHARQEYALERLKSSYDKSPYTIRRMLTEGAVRAADKRAQFVGIDAYEGADGVVLRDLFQTDDGGWLQDTALLDRLVADKLGEVSDPVFAEGWKWVEVAPDFPYGHTFGLRQLRGEPVPLTDAEEASRLALQAEYDSLLEAHDGLDDLPEEIDERLGELEKALEAFDARPPSFDPMDVARAGAFVSVVPDGRLKVERGFVRAEDEPRADDAHAGDEADASGEMPSGATAADGDNEPTADLEEDDARAAISDRLLTELTEYRTVALRNSLSQRPDVAFLAALHALTLDAFYRHASESCLELDLRSPALGAQTPGLGDSAAAEAIRTRHETWSRTLPEDPGDLWDALGEWDADDRTELFAHVVGLSVQAVHQAWNRRPLAHADRLAAAVDLDMVEAGWRPTVATYLGRVTKSLILAAVTEGRGEQAAERLAPLKKTEMATEAETLLADTGWLPPILRTPGTTSDPSPTAEDSTTGDEPPLDVPAIAAE